MWLQELVLNSFLYKLFYNILIGLSNIFPYASIAVAVIVLTLLVKTILIPLTYRSIRNQIQQKKIQPLLNEIKKRYADDQKKQSEEMMALYKEHKTNPFSGCVLVIIQIIVIIPLYYVFRYLDIHPDLLYSFIQVPEKINLLFFGINLTEQSIVLAVLAGIAQFIQLYFSPAMREVKTKETSQEETSLQADMAKNMQKSMKYSMPIMIIIFAYITPAAVALYWIVSNLFTIAQEIVIRKKLSKEETDVAVTNL